tara:strand:- start:62 stop:655 length:594 start_codon:yes stop_codon:yes gene_type:complete
MTDILQQKIKDNKKGKNYTYSDMLIYNDLKNDNKIGPGLDLLREVYDKLYGFGLSLSGYQFIGLMVGEALIEDDTHYIFLFAYFMLAIGFIVSLFGSLLSFCMWQFITYIKTESPNYIIESIIKYKYELQLPHYILEINTFCFALPINILIYKNLDKYYGIGFNIASVILLLTGFPIHYKMVSKNQQYETAIAQILE